MGLFVLFQFIFTDSSWIPFQLLEKPNKVMAPKQFSCCYFPAEFGAVVLEKKKLALRSDFKPLGEINVRFTVENEKGDRKRLLSTLVKF